MSTFRGKNFCPFNNYIVSASTTSTNQVVTQPTAVDGYPNNPATDLLISNNTTGVAYVAFGMTAQTATSSNFAVLPGAVMCIDMGGPMTNVAVLLSTSSGSVYISIGSGT